MKSLQVFPLLAFLAAAGPVSAAHYQVTSDEITVSFASQPDKPVAGTTTVTATATGSSIDRLFVDVEVTSP